MNHPLSDMMMSSMGKIRDMIDVNTVIGEPIAAGDVTIIPVTKVSIGYGAGGSDFATKNYPANRDNAFGGGAGAGVNITPVAFLVVRGESVRMLPVAEPASTSMDRLIEQLPDLLDKAEHLLKQKRLANEDELEILGMEGQEVEIYEPVGCPNCDNSGYRGRIGVYEIMEVNNDVKRCIAKGGDADAIKDVALQNGMSTLRMSATRYVLQGITSVSEMIKVSFES